MNNNLRKVPFSSISGVLNKVMSNLGLDRRLREHTFMGLWPTFVSSGIADRSRPLFIDAERNIVVSVADAATGQELAMIKGKVLPKVTFAARGLNIDIRGIRIDLKHYHSTSTLPKIEEEKPLPKPSAEDLQRVRLTAADLQSLTELQERLEVEETKDAALRTKILQCFEAELRMRAWRLLNNFPLCPLCGNPTERLHPPSAALHHKRAADLPPMCLTCLHADEL